MARAKLTPLAASLRSLHKPTPAPEFQRAGIRRHFAKGPPTAKDVAPTRSKPMKESATSSLWTGDIITLLFQSLKIMPDPDEVLRKAGLTRASLKKLLYDDDIGQAVDTRREAAINTPWRLEGGAEDPNAFIVDQVKLYADRIFGGCFNARLFGYSVTQLVYQNLDGGRVGLRWVGEMPIQFYFPQRDGTVLYRPQAQGEPIPLLPQKYLIPVVMPTYENPYGEALLSKLYWLWFFRTHGWQYWAQWLEQFGAPFLHGKTANIQDPVTGAKSVDALAALLDKSRRGSALATDKDTEVALLGTTGTGQQFKFFDDAVSRQIARVVLGQTLTSSEGKHGTQALGSIHEEVRQDKRRADVKILKGCGQQLVNTLWELNAFGGTPAEFVMEDEKGLQDDRAKRDALLVEKGVLVFTRAYLEDHYDLESDDFHAAGEDGFTAAKAMPTDPNADPNANPAGNPAKPGQKKKPAVAPDKAKKNALAFLSLFSRDGSRFTPDQEVIEEGVALLTESLPDAILANEDIHQAIREASDANDLANRLAVVMQGADANEFRIVLEKALLAASVIGYVHSAEHPGT